MASQDAPFTVNEGTPNQGRRVGEFFFALILWALIGILVQWLMPLSTNDTINITSLAHGNAHSTTTFWNALEVVALFFTVLAFLLRDFATYNPIAKGLSIVAIRVLATTFDLGMFAFGGYLFLKLTGDASIAATEHATLWQQLLFVNFGVFVVSLVVLGVLLFLLRCTRITLLSLPFLEYKPFLRLVIYIILLIVLALVGFFAL